MSPMKKPSQTKKQNQNKINQSAPKGALFNNP